MGGAAKQLVRTWFLETRPQFLIISLAVILLGTSVAWYYGQFSLPYFLLALLGMLLAHTSANTLNDYFDYKSGIDLQVNKTAYTGGSGILSAGLLSSVAVGRFGFVCFLLAIPIGVFFVVAKGWLLLPVLMAGALSVLLYTARLSRWGLGEIAAGLGLGMLPVLGAYFVQTGTYTWEAVIAAVPSGILLYTGLLLYEFPDMEADMNGGKKTIPILIGKKNASLLYVILMITIYAWIAAWAIMGFMTIFALLGLLTVPLGVKAIKGALHYDEESKLSPALKANLMVIIGTQGLLAVGYAIAAVV